MCYRYRRLDIICTNSTVYTRVLPCLWASYNHLLHDEYNSIQCSSGVHSKITITTIELLQFFFDQRIKLLFKRYAFSNGFLEALFGGRSLDCGAMLNEVEGER